MLSTADAGRDQHIPQGVAEDRAAPFINKESVQRVVDNCLIADNHHRPDQHDVTRHMPIDSAVATESGCDPGYM